MNLQISKNEANFTMIILTINSKLICKSYANYFILVITLDIRQAFFHLGKTSQCQFGDTQNWNHHCRYKFCNYNSQMKAKEMKCDIWRSSNNSEFKKYIKYSINYNIVGIFGFCEWDPLKNWTLHNFEIYEQ